MKWFLIGACLILATITAAQWWLWPEQLPAGRQTTTAGAPEQDVEQTLPNSIPHYRLPPREVYQEIDKRPLFVDDRRPPASGGTTALSQAPTEDKPLPPHLGLTAILQTADGTMALIKDRKEKQILRVEQGGDLAGWKIVSILPDRLVLSQGKMRREMLLREFHVVPPEAVKPKANPASRARAAKKAQLKKSAPRRPRRPRRQLPSSEGP